MTAHPPTSRRTRLVVGALAVLVIAACEPEPSPTPEPAAFDGRLLIHTGRPEANQLFALDGRGDETEVAPPEGGLRWFAAAPDGRLAGIVADGSIVVAGGAGEAWLPVSSEEVPPEATDADVRLPAWSPDGRLAVVFARAAAARIAGVLVVDPATDGGLWIDLDAGLGGYPPAWLDRSHVTVPTRDGQDRPTIAILDADAGATDVAPRGVRALVASPDGSTLAVLAADGRTVELWRPAAWLAEGDGVALGRVRASDGTSVEAFALDRTGDRLAVGSVAPDGTTDGAVAVYDGTDDWSFALERSMAAGAPVGALGFVP